jgi:hypothetical protein
MAKRAAPTALSAAADALAAAGAARQARALQAPAAKPVLTASDRENPDKLTGEDLRALAHRRGIARSEAQHMDDDKLRMQLRYITNRQYADEEA